MIKMQYITCSAVSKRLFSYAMPMMATNGLNSLRSNSHTRSNATMSAKKTREIRSSRFRLELSRARSVREQKMMRTSRYACITV